MNQNLRGHAQTGKSFFNKQRRGNAYSGKLTVIFQPTSFFCFSCWRFSLFQSLAFPYLMLGYVFFFVFYTDVPFVHFLGFLMCMFPMSLQDENHMLLLWKYLVLRCQMLVSSCLLLVFPFSILAHFSCLVLSLFSLDEGHQFLFLCIAWFGMF